MSKIKSFEKFVSEMDRSDEIEKELEILAEPQENDEEDAEKVQGHGESEEGEEDQEHDEELEESEDVTPLPNVDKKPSDKIPVYGMLEKCYEALDEEAKEWAEDAHDEHTIESYMAENAALVASMAVESLTRLKGDMETEAYEACLNKMSEAYTKKINECKENNTASDAEDIEV